MKSNNNRGRQKVLVICGPTATGKTDLALEVCRIFNGEIVSADSRQVYQGMNIGTGKDLPKNAIFGKYQIPYGTGIIKAYCINQIPVWMYDVIPFSGEINVSLYVKMARVVMDDIFRRGKLPVITGGTGFYIKALIDGFETMGVPPDFGLRNQLESESIPKLQKRLNNQNALVLQFMNDSDKNNRRRLIRKIEIENFKKTCGVCIRQDQLLCDLLMIGLKTDNNQSLYQRIDQRVDRRVAEGIEEEISGLLKSGATWEMHSLSSIGYQEWRQWFSRESEDPVAEKKQIISRWKFREHEYARRQLTWFSRDKRINWVDITVPNWQKTVTRRIWSWYNFR